MTAPLENTVPTSATPPSRAEKTPREKRAPSAETTRLYASDWNGFVVWCRQHGLASFPAAPATVAAFLAAHAGALSHGAMARRLAAIAGQHKSYGHASPCADPEVKAIMRDARKGAVPRRAPPPPASSLARMASSCAGDLTGLRDRALLLLASQTGLGRADLVGLDAECVRFTAAGAELLIRDRFDATAAARAVTLRRGATSAGCPARALEAWMRASDCQYGPVFRKVDRWGNVEHRRLCTDAIRRICARRQPARSTPAGSTAPAVAERGQAS